MAVTRQIWGTGVEMTDDDRWQAVQDREIQLDGVFVYAVRTTGIYCRPSCPSRRPKREHAIFFPSAGEAERAGFHPCRRCQPEDATSASVALVQRACRQIEQHTDGPVKLANLGRELAISPYHLQRTFKRIMGVTPRQYGESCRLARLKDRLRAGEEVTTALYGVGYGSSSRLYEQAQVQLGMTPNTYRRGGRGARIRYTILDSQLGRVLLAATQRGICSIALGDSDAELEDYLVGEYPAAEITRDDVGLHAWVQSLCDHLAGQGTLPHLPVDPTGTAFQRQVWQALSKIPYGTTRSYSDIAHSLGQPSAARAVARACAANPVAILVPCHRAVRKDGGLGGYRWGLERKRALLARERD